VPAAQIGRSWVMVALVLPLDIGGPVTRTADGRAQLHSGPYRTPHNRGGPSRVTVRDDPFGTATRVGGGLRGRFDAYRGSSRDQRPASECRVERLMGAVVGRQSGPFRQTTSGVEPGVGESGLWLMWHNS
jgi:hypothetical protein